MADQPERRDVSFQNLDEVIADAERLAAGDVRTTGNHSFGQILNHLALSLDAATGRVTPPAPPFYLRLMRPLMRRMVFNGKPLKPGIKLPASGEAFFWPDEEFDVSTALAALKEAAENYKVSGPLDTHPFFGDVSEEESDSLNMRHAALHLSFVHPVG